MRGDCWRGEVLTAGACLARKAGMKSIAFLGARVPFSSGLPLCLGKGHIKAHIGRQARRGNQKRRITHQRSAHNGWPVQGNAIRPRSDSLGSGA